MDIDPIYIQGLYLLFALVYTAYLPTYFISLLLFRNIVGQVPRLGLSLLVVIAVVPLLAFSLALIAGTVINEAIIFGVASAINLTGLLYKLSRYKRRIQEE